MLTSPAQRVFLVYTSQDDAFAASLHDFLSRHDHKVTDWEVSASFPVVDERTAELAKVDVVLICASGWLFASGWLNSELARAVVPRAMVARREGISLLGSRLQGCPSFVVEMAAEDLGSSTVSPSSVLPADDALGNPAEERLFGLLWLMAHDDPSVSEERIEEALAEVPPRIAEGGIVGGRFRVLCRVGNGPLAGVWRALDAHGGQVALKVLHPQWVGTSTEEAFRRGGHRGVASPGLAKIEFVSGLDDPVGTFVARTWGERTLADRVRGGELDLPSALQAIVDVGEGLRALHEAGVVHGAVKPSNVLYVGERVVLADAVDSGVSGTDATDVLFLAPETQEPGRKAHPAADIYSLGMMALNALFGAVLPFWVLRDPERLLAEVDAPDALKEVLRKALDWDPAGRYSSVDAFMEGVLNDSTVVRMLCERASESGRHDAVARYLKRLMESGDGSSPSLLLALGRAQLAAGEFEEARASFVGATNSPSRADALSAARGLAEVAALLGGAETRVAELLTRADGLSPLGVELLVDAAELQEGAAARQTWESVLEYHLEKGQARRALEFLVEEANDREDWPSVFRLGALQHGFLAEEERPKAALRLGRIAMDRLQDPARALTWLQIASEALDDTELVRRLESIRSARGEWRQVVSLMLERAEGLEDELAAVELMLRAARVALYAHNHHDDAASIMLRVLLRDPEHRSALRFLARYHARARRDDRALALYARLAPHEERGREGEPTEVRVADNVDYARLLLRNDRPRGAQLCLEAALDLNPGHIPTLALTSQLSFDLGKWEEARVATRGLVAAFSSAEADGTFCGSLRRLGNLAWLYGDLITASQHFNRVLELAPEDVESWWGRAKIALAGNAGRLDEEVIREAPWLTAAPVRITPHEALARLLAGILGRASVERWMRLDPLGKAMLELLSAQSDLVLTSAVVDLLQARQLIRGSLFRRLRGARPAWEFAVKVVEEMWFSPLSKKTFPVADSYRWCEQPRDFDPRHHRDAQRMSSDPEGPVDVRASLSTLHHESAWTTLLSWTGALPVPPSAEEIEVGEGIGQAPTAVLILFPDAPDRSGGGSPARRVLRVGDGDVIGAAMDEVSLPLATLEPEHLRFEAVGDFLYVRALGPLTIDGERVTQRRLCGGENLRIGTVDARFYLHEEELSGRGFEGSGLKSTVVGHQGFDLDAPYIHQPKAALFYSEGGHERMLPIVGERVGVYEDVEGCLMMERGSTDAEMLVLQKGGAFHLRSTGDASTQLLEHQDRFEVGTRTVEFRILDQVQLDGFGSGRSETREPPPMLVYEDGSRHGRPIPLTQEVFTLGRGRSADFQISADASLSRVHCQVVLEEGLVFVEDAGSSNGTKVNGIPVEGRHPLESGDIISIGQTQLEFVLPSKDAHPLGAQHDLLPDDPTDIIPVRERSRGGLPVEEGINKLRVVNVVLEGIFNALDAQEGLGRGQAFLENLVAARPRAYQGLLDELDVSTGLPAMEVLYNLAQRPEQEQRPLINFVLGDLIDRAVDAAAEILDDEPMDALLTLLASTRYRDHLRF